ncbi:hypothetical protein SHIRM173S_01821 [Streptomyces hirsutus]
MAGGEGREPGQGAQRRALAGAVRAEQGDDLARCGGEGDVQAEGAVVDDEAGVEALGLGGAGLVTGEVVSGLTGVGHDAVIQRSRRPASTAIETASRTTLSAMAASGSLCRAR